PAERALWAIFQDVYEGEARRALTGAAFKTSYEGLGDLSVLTIGVGLRDPRDRVRNAFQTVRDDAVEHGLASLESEDADRREASQDELLRLGDLARMSLDRIAKGGDPKHRSAEAALSSERLAHRIRFHLSRALIRKLGHELEDYETLPFDKRRSAAFELERL